MSEFEVGCVTGCVCGLDGVCIYESQVGEMGVCRGDIKGYGEKLLNPSCKLYLNALGSFLG